MSASVAIIFDTRHVSVTNGKIVFGNIVPGGDPHNYDFYIGVTSPSGESLKAFPDDGSPDVANALADSNTKVSVGIPLDDNGKYLGGTYTFRIRIENNVNGDDETWDLEYVYDPKVYKQDNLTGDLEVTTSMNCLNGVLTATDENDYDALGITMDDRDLTITPPSVDTQSEVTTADASAEIEPAYTNAPYQVLLFIEFTWDEDTLQDAVGTVGPVTVESTGTLNLYKVVNVECETGGICGSLPCIQEAMDAAYTHACMAGGFANLSSTEKDNLVWGVLNLLVAKASYDCGQVAKSLIYNSRATAGLDCSCGCSDTENDEPVPFTPPA